MAVRYHEEKSRVEAGAEFEQHIPPAGEADTGMIDITGRVVVVEVMKRTPFP
jgi:hypothetical protein